MSDAEEILKAGGTAAALNAAQCDVLLLCEVFRAACRIYKGACGVYRLPGVLKAPCAAKRTAMVVPSALDR
jgi:hypothetical protein